MTDRPIIFSAPMVRALLDGRKTQTRRILKPAKYSFDNNIKLPDGANKGEVRLNWAIGDRLWVREAVCWVSAHGWKYRADNDDLSDFRAQGEVSKWAPSIHMPRHASRLTLIVSAVRVQRLQEISEADAQAEGAQAIGAEEGPDEDERSFVWGFQKLWTSIHGPGAWDANPWVCAIGFTVHRQNIDAMKEADQ